MVVVGGGALFCEHSTFLGVSRFRTSEKDDDVRVWREEEVVFPPHHRCPCYSAPMAFRASSFGSLGFVFRVSGFGSSGFGFALWRIRIGGGVGAISDTSRVQTGMLIASLPGKGGWVATEISTVGQGQLRRDIRKTHFWNTCQRRYMFDLAAASLDSGVKPGVSSTHRGTQLKLPGTNAF